MQRAKSSLWLEEQIDRQDPVGDLARDASGGKGTYKLPGLREWFRYLESQHADHGAYKLPGLREWIKYLESQPSGGIHENTHCGRQ